jgi:glycosyltransferase involved in cell wall biosynthesis
MSKADGKARLKICLITEPLDAGVGRHVTDVACALAERGHEVHLIYSPIRVDPRLTAVLERHPNLRRVTIPMPRSFGIGDISALFGIARYLKAAGPFDVVHGHSSKGGAYARLLKLFSGGRVFYTPNAFVTMSAEIPRCMCMAYSVIEATLARLTDRIICVSQVERNHAVDLGISAERLTVISNALGIAAWTPREAARERLGLAPDQVVLGFVGRMVAQKAPERVIAAVQSILPKFPSLALLMIGDGPHRDSLERRLNEAGLGARVRWLGAVDAREYISAFDMLVVSSRYEGFAYVLLEALSVGLPIISTPVGGADEAVTPGVNGFIVAHGSNAEMAKAIGRLASDPVLRHAMGEASRQKADSFPFRHMVDATEALYFSVGTAPREQFQPQFADTDGVITT